MEEDLPEPSLLPTVVPDEVPTEQQSFGPWMLVERKRNRKKHGNKANSNLGIQEKQSKVQGDNSVSQLTKAKNGSKPTSSKSNDMVDKAFNDIAVTHNGSLTNVGPNIQQEHIGPQQKDNQVSSNIFKQSQIDLNHVLVQENPKSTVTDKISLNSKSTRSKMGNKNMVEPIRSVNHGKSVQSKSSASYRNVGNGSNLTHEAESDLGHLSCQRRQPNSSYGGSLGDSTGKEPSLSGRMGPRHNSKKMGESNCGDQRDRSSSPPTSTNRVDSFPTIDPSPGHVFHHSSAMKLDGRNCRIGLLGGTNLSTDHTGSNELSFSQQSVDDGKHEDGSRDHHEGIGPMLNGSALQSDPSSVLLPRSQYDGQEANRGLSLVDARTGQMGHELFQ
ncbi:hypothetical protein SLA2020_498020 [Shorea laevis]